MSNSIPNAVEIFYESVNDTYDYHSALRAYSKAVDGTGVACTEFNPLSLNVTVHAAHNIERKAVEGWHSSLERCDALKTLAKAALKIPLYIPAMRRTFVSDELWEHSKTYQRVSAPWGYHDDGASILSRSFSKIITCGFVLHSDQERLDPDMLAAMAYMNKHLMRPMSLQHSLSRLERTLIETNNVLDMIDFGLVMFGTNAKIEFANISARRIFEANDGLSLSATTLQIECVKSQKRLDAILDALDSGKPQQNAFAESFNGRLRDECLNETVFSTLSGAREVLAAWQYDYNRVRPHSSLNNKTPKEFFDHHTALAATTASSQDINPGLSL